MSSSTPPALEQIYTDLRSYPFATDSEYQLGLATIIGHPSTPATPEEVYEQPELVLQAQCFYFSRKFHIVPEVDVLAYAEWLDKAVQREGSAQQAAYQEWRRTRGVGSYAEFLQYKGQEAEPDTRASSNAAAPAAPAPAPTEPRPPQTQSSQFQVTPTTSGPDPPYPTSFAAIVDLITRNQPVPGIEEIPPTVLDPGSSKIDKTPRRKKPWETDAARETGTETETETGRAASGDGETGPVEADSSPPATRTNGTFSGQDAQDTTIEFDTHRETGEGIVKILQPSAIPDSGLLSKD